MLLPPLSPCRAVLWCCAVPCRAVPCCAALCRAVPRPPACSAHARVLASLSRRRTHFIRRHDMRACLLPAPLPPAFRAPCLARPPLVACICMHAFACPHACAGQVLLFAQVRRCGGARLPGHQDRHLQLGRDGAVGLPTQYVRPAVVSGCRAGWAGWLAVCMACVYVCLSVGLSGWLAVGLLCWTVCLLVGLACLLACLLVCLSGLLACLLACWFAGLFV